MAQFSVSAQVITAFSLVRYENPEVVEVQEEEKNDEQEVLESILPAREWEEEGKLWRQRISASPATRLDVLQLQEQLDQKLEQRQARETGICQVATTLLLASLPQKHLFTYLLPANANEP